MTAPRRLRTSEDDIVPRCHRCQSGKDLIEGDGPVVCRACIRLLGGIAGNPADADNRILTALLERHGDVVRLERSPEVRGVSPASMRWAWTDTWPT